MVELHRRTEVAVDSVNPGDASPASAREVALDEHDQVPALHALQEEVELLGACAVGDGHPVEPPPIRSARGEVPIPPDDRQGMGRRTEVWVQSKMLFSRSSRASLVER